MSKAELWRSRVQAYCHDVWGRGGFEGLTDAVWAGWYSSPARPQLSEWEFAVHAVLPYVATRAVRADCPPPAEFATVRAVTARLRDATKMMDVAKKTFGAAARVAKTESVPAKPTEEPEPAVDVGVLEQPPRTRPKGAMPVYAAGGPPPDPPDSLTPRGLFIWAENVTELMLQERRFPTIECLVGMLHACLDRDDAVVAARTLQSLYDQEDQIERRVFRQMYLRALEKPAEVKSSRSRRAAKPPKAPPGGEPPAPRVELKDGVKTVLGHNLRSLVRWAGAAGWAMGEVTTFLGRLGVRLKAEKVERLVRAGRAGDKRAADVDAAQEKILESFMKGTGNAEAPSPGDEGRDRPRGEGREKAARGEPEVPARPVPAEGRVKRADGRKEEAAVRAPDQPARVHGRTGRAPAR